MTNILYDALIAPHAANSAVFLQTDQGETIAFSSFVERTAQIAHTLVCAGMKPGGRVVVQAPKLADTIALYGATVQAGGVYLPLNTDSTQAEIAYFLGDAEPTLVVCDAKDEAAMREICKGAQVQVLTLAADGTGSLSQTANKMETSFDTVERDPDDLAALLYTSGTTGRSKGAMLSHNNLLSNARALTQEWQISDQDRLIHALPIFHTHGLFVAMNTSLLSGATVRFMSKFDLDTVLKEISQSTMLMGVPTFYTRLLSTLSFTKNLCANMRLFVSGSAPLLAETHIEFEGRTGHRILERYGMTETNMITSNPYEGERIAGTVGFALAGTEVIITDVQTGEPLAAGEIGMIEVRGANVFQGYLNMPEKTREELRANGFFITGDLGVMKKDGRVSIVGRHKDLIISGGYNIYPKEIEDVINDVEGVLESAVFGVPHPDFGESVIAAIILKSGDQDLTQTISKAVETNLARFKHPRIYEVMEALPRNTMGKVQKNVLRAQYISN